MSSLYLSGDLLVQVSKEVEQSLLDIDLSEFDLEYNCEIFASQPQPSNIPEDRVEILLGFSDETSYGWDDGLGQLVQKVHELCGKYPEGHIIEETEGEGTYRVEIDPKTGEIIEDSCSWLSDYPIEINRKCYEYAQKLMAEAENKNKLEQEVK